MSADPRATLALLVAAFERHLEVSTSKRDPDDPTVVASALDLADAFDDYDEALFLATEVMTPLVVDADDDEDLDDDDLDDEDLDDEDDEDDEDEDDEDEDDEEDEEDEDELDDEDTGVYSGLDDDDLDYGEDDEHAASPASTDSTR